MAPGRRGNVIYLAPQEPPRLALADLDQPSMMEEEIDRFGQASRTGPLHLSVVETSELCLEAVLVSPWQVLPKFMEHLTALTVLVLEPGQADGKVVWLRILESEPWPKQPRQDGERFVYRAKFTPYEVRDLDLISSRGGRNNIKAGELYLDLREEPHLPDSTSLLEAKTTADPRVRTFYLLNCRFDPSLGRPEVGTP